MRVFSRWPVIPALMLSAGVLPTGAAAQTKTVWDGIYTRAQAIRGEAVFATSCQGCHRALPDRVAPAENGGRFMDAWTEDSLDNLFTVIKDSMPRDAPASLTDAAYTDIVAYLLQLNAFPAGSEELQPGTLAGIRVQAKDGPGPVPNFALVRVVGCLTQGPDQSWVLTHATEPMRTRDPEAARDAERKDGGPPTSGVRTFRLLQLYRGSDGGSGSQVEAKGFLIKAPGDDRINVTSLRTVAETCEN